MKMEDKGVCPLCGKAADSLSNITLWNGRCDILAHSSVPPNAEKNSVQSSGDCAQGTPKSAAESEVSGGLDPSTSGKECTDLSKVCKKCKELVRTKLPALPCSGCEHVFHIICDVHLSKADFTDLSEEVKNRWKCQACFKKLKESNTTWKCPACFSRDSFCGSCKKPAENPSDTLRCTKCQQMCHYYCEGIKIEKFCTMSKQEKDKWQCKQETVKLWKKIGKHVAISGGLTAVCLGGIPLAVGALGFGAAGVTGGSLAAAYQSAYLGGNIVAGSVFAVLQSVGAAGLAASTQAGIFAACSASPFLGYIKIPKSQERMSAEAVEQAAKKVPGSGSSSST